MRLLAPNLVARKSNQRGATLQWMFIGGYRTLAYMRKHIRRLLATQLRLTSHNRGDQAEGFDSHRSSPTWSWTSNSCHESLRKLQQCQPSRSGSIGAIGKCVVHTTWSCLMGLWCLFCDLPHTLTLWALWDIGRRCQHRQSSCGGNWRRMKLGRHLLQLWNRRLRSTLISVQDVPPLNDSYCMHWTVWRPFHLVASGLAQSTQCPSIAGRPRRSLEPARGSSRR